MRRPPEYPCPTCGGFARTILAPDKAAGRPDTQYACARCGTVLPSLPWAQTRRAIRHQMPLRVGMKAQIGGKDYWAVGLTRYKEKDSESTSTWWEWTLLSPDGDARFLEYDAGKWTLIEEVAAPADVPPGLLMTARQGGKLTVGGRSWAVSEAGTSTIDAVDGQIPWPIRVGQRLRYVEVSQGSESLSAEVALGPDGKPEAEPEWFRQRPADVRQVLTWFNLQEELRALEKHQATMRQRAGFGGFCLLLGLLSFLVWGVAGRAGRIVAEGTVSAAQIPDGGMRFGPYNLNRVGRVYRLRVGTALTGTSLYAQAVVENPDAGPSFDVEGELWDESGYDDEGYWHESQLQSQRDFRLDAPRDMYVRVFADPDQGATDAPVSFAIEEAALTPGPPLTFGILASILGVCWLCSSGAQKKWSDG